ncbi:MAG: LPS-assembly protein LptD, partial [Draconibacterium sp.]|nr:LPS-assembly protein LptD [Draconibacterium sp.]
YVNFSPGISYNETWYFDKKNYTYHEDEVFSDPYGNESHVKVDTINGFNRVYSYAYSISSSTNIYGMYMPRNPDSKIKGIRHKFTPSASFSYRPDFGQEKFGYWQTVQVDSTGRVEYFDINAGGVYGGSPGRGASGAISLSINNNVEMKILDTKDSTSTDDESKFRKVKIIDNLSFASSYNLIADSLNLSPISMRARTTIKGVSINMGGILDPYELDENYRKINKFTWNERSGIQKLGRLTRANLSFGMNFKSKKGEEKAEDKKELIEENNILQGDYDDYIDFDIPWDFGFNYSINYSGPSFSKPNGNVTQTLGFRGNLNLTQKWRISMNTNFDIMAQEFSFTTININRDLHCWSMAFNFVPFGYMKSYSFTINAKASLLKDLKLEKRQSHYDNF